jgi:hypothetical protein
MNSLKYVRTTDSLSLEADRLIGCKGDKMQNYWKQNGFVKRINNFAVYLFCAIASIFIPEVIDTILYRTLKQQFEEKDAEQQVQVDSDKQNSLT